MITHASSSIDMVMYSLQDTDIEKALVADAGRGIRVRVILNRGYYGKQENDRNVPAYEYLTTHGVEVHWAPSYFALTHEKSMVIDGLVGVIMTMNLQPQYYASGREFVVVDVDQADVTAMRDAFTSDWNGSHATASNGDTLVWSPGSEQTLIDLIDQAKTSLKIYNEEMADGNIVRALATASARGVDVEIVMTYSNNWKKAFTKLANAGVHIHTFSRSAPLYIHAKVIIADDTKAFVGSENFSSNSLNKNRELGTIINNPDIISQIGSVFAKDYAVAKEFVPSPTSSP
jgi:phosphatidylserine/phosphatidylglycerophosphate/cardiolipin synthase-like enzyme